MKNKILSIIIICVVLLLDLIFIFSKEKDYSSLENRYLSKISQFKIDHVWDGRFMNNFTNYVKDQFPFRDFFMGIKTNFEKITLKTKINDVYLGKDNYLIDNYNSIKNKDKLIRIFNDFNDNNKINLNLVLVPTSISFNEDKLPKFSNYSNQLEDINYIYKNISFNSIDLFDDLNSNNKDEDMFYHLDHHWTTDGAFIAYNNIISKLGYNALEKNNFNVKTVSNDFYGTLYSKTNDYTRKPDSIKVYEYNNNLNVYYADDNKNTNSLYEFDYLNKKDKYSLFLDNNHSLIVITNNSIDNNNELVVIKDSFANSLVPFLANHYKKVHVIDPRYYMENISKYISDNPNIKEGIILYNINTLEDDLGVYRIK